MSSESMSQRTAASQTAVQNNGSMLHFFVQIAGVTRRNPKRRPVLMRLDLTFCKCLREGGPAVPPKRLSQKSSAKNLRASLMQRQEEYLLNSRSASSRAACDRSELNNELRLVSDSA